MLQSDCRICEFKRFYSLDGTQYIVEQISYINIIINDAKKWLNQSAKIFTEVTFIFFGAKSYLILRNDSISHERRILEILMIMLKCFLFSLQQITYKIQSRTLTSLCSGSTSIIESFAFIWSISSFKMQAPTFFTSTCRKS